MAAVTALSLVLAATLAILPPCVRLECELVFHSCELGRPSVGGSFFSNRKCVIRKIWHGERLQYCSDDVLTTVVRDVAEVMKFCDNKCRTRPGWCHWSSWSAAARCGDRSIRLRRKREKGCHPVTRRPIITGSRRPEVQRERKAGPYRPCDDRTKGRTRTGRPEPFSMTGLIVGCVVVVCVMCALALYCKWRSQRRRRDGRQPPMTTYASVQLQQPTATSAQPPQLSTMSTQTLQPSAQPPETSATSTQPLQPSAPPECDDLPPSYDDAVMMKT